VPEAKDFYFSKANLFVFVVVFDKVVLNRKKMRKAIQQTIALFIPFSVRK